MIGDWCSRSRSGHLNTWQATLAPLLCVAMVFAVKVYCVDLIGYWLIWSVVLQSCWCYFSLCGLNVCNINNINNIWRTTLHTRITSTPTNLSLLRDPDSVRFLRSWDLSWLPLWACQLYITWKLQRQATHSHNQTPTICHHYTICNPQNNCQGNW